MTSTASTTTTTATARHRGIRIAAALLATAAVGALTLAPRSIVAPARGLFMRFIDALAEPLPAWIPAGDAEQLLNTLLFVPLGATIALLLARHTWPIAVLAACALSAVIEHAQASIPGRVPDLHDVLWNTLGGSIGVAIVTLARVLVAAINRHDQRGRTTRT